MRTFAAILLIFGLTACKSETRSEPDDTANTSAEEPYASGELFLGFAPGGGDNSDAEPVDACYFTGPGETVVLVEFLDAPQIVNPSRDCEDPDPYRMSYGLVSARVLRTAFGAKLETFEAILYDERRTAGGTGLRKTQAGQIELWSMRKGGDEWFVQSRWPVSVSKTSTDFAASEGISLPSKWTEMVQELREARDNHVELCTDGVDTHLDNNRRMTDEEFDVWAHSPDDPESLCKDVGVDVYDTGHPIQDMN